MVYMKKLVIGILAHVDAGKTTLSEGMLYLSGSINKLGRVDHKDAFLDHNQLERERGITIFSKQAVLPLPEVEITLMFSILCCTFRRSSPGTEVFHSTAASQGCRSQSALPCGQAHR